MSLQFIADCFLVDIPLVEDFAQGFETVIETRFYGVERGVEHLGDFAEFQPLVLKAWDWPGAGRR